MRYATTAKCNYNRLEGIKRKFFSTVFSIDKEIDLYSKKKQTTVSLKTLMDSGLGNNLNTFQYGAMQKSQRASDKVLMQVACFLHRELPVRLAHRATKLEGTPIFNKSGK